MTSEDMPAVRPEDTWPEWLRDRPKIPLYAIEGPERWRLFQGVLLGGVSTALLLALVFNERVIDPVVIFAALYTLVGGVVIRWRRDRRVSIAGVVLAMVGLGANAPFLAGDLLHPESWGSFMPAALAVAGVVSSTASAVAGLRGVPSDHVVTMFFGVIVACCAIVAASLVASLAAGNDGPRSGDRFLIASGSAFTPTLSVPAAVSTGVVITNDDMVRHTFLVEGTEVRLELPATKSRRVELRLRAGEYRYFCDVPGHEQMEGTLTVR